MRRAAGAACTIALALGLVVDAPAARAGEEVFRPVVPAVGKSVSKSSTISVGESSTLKWRVRGVSSSAEPQQPAVQASDDFTPTTAKASEAKQVSAVEPVKAKPNRSSVIRAAQISSRQTRSRLRDSVMQVNTYQDPEAPPFGDVPAAEEPAAPVRDPYESPSNPAGSTPPAVPMDNGPPAMPNELESPSDNPPPAADDLFKDPIPAPRQPAELPSDMREELLDRGLSTEPGGVGCENQKSECQEALHELQKRDITTITVGLLIEGVEGTDFPCDCRLGRDFDAPQFAGRNFAPTLFTWKASGTCHKPLYFEDVQLERYGHSWNPVIQPFMSGAHFFVSVPLLPYKMGLRPPNECVYTLGYYRPGNCAPYMFEPIPLSLRAAVAEGFGAAAFAFWFWPPN